MNVEKLREIVSENEEIANRSVILSVEYMRSLRSRVNMASDLLSVFGKENVECLDFITQKLILVTFVNESVCSLGSLKTIQYKPSNSSQQHALYYNVHSIQPIKARVEGILTGVPHFYSSSQLPKVTETIEEKMPTLTDIKLDYIPWPGTSIMCGDMSVKALTTDLSASHAKLVQQTPLPLGDFEGQMSFKIIELVDLEENSDLPVEKKDDITLHNWCY
ncbi:uncharacterized protein LOC135195664 [Macrobrachium nipponense]|uniref:uncharacterized protein LOC135195664 n=1 Tax=Macrobrachium nipponense TaxID=159736 RepID=UPI0030C83F95